MPMQHLWVVENDLLTVDYRWKKEKWNSLKLIAAANPEAIKEGSEEEFITEHYWGYTKVSNSKTSEYGVEHPRWQVYRVIDHTINVDFEDIYGPEFACLTTQKPKSVFLAEGSTVVVKKGITI